MHLPRNAARQRSRQSIRQPSWRAGRRADVPGQARTAQARRDAGASGQWEETDQGVMENIETYIEANPLFAPSLAAWM